MCQILIRNLAYAVVNLCITTIVEYNAVAKEKVDLNHY